MKEHPLGGKPLKTLVEITVYYAVLYFLDRYLMAPYVYRGIHRESYSLTGLLGVTAMAVALVGLLILAPFLAGRMNRDRWAVWGCLAFLLNLAVYALASLAVSLVTGDAFIHTGLSVERHGFIEIMHLLYVVALYCLAAWLGSRSARSGARARVIRRTRKLALG